jgi:hypothetical protein
MLTLDELISYIALINTAIISSQIELLHTYGFDSRDASSQEHRALNQELTFVGGANINLRLS